MELVAAGSAGCGTLGDGSDAPEFWMRKAMVVAEEALVVGEVPVGCVIVAGGKVGLAP
jgi:tRNA(Arg) A34 adenosine deaminase TadA